jgi:5'-nucleotidase
LRILLSNDDGIHAPGLNILANRLAENAAHQVYIVAPDRQRSATGHSLTLHKPLRVQHVELDPRIKGAWATTGTPSDCVKLAIAELLDSPPDLIISGINAGPNLGADVLYSGTVAAAMEGASLNFPAIAVSAVTAETAVFNMGAEFIHNFLDLFMQLPRVQRGLLNVNIPSQAAGGVVKGVRATELGLRLYDDKFEKRSDPYGRDYYWLSGQAIEEGEAETSDVHAVKLGYISVTPVTFTMTDHNAVQQLNQLQALHELNYVRP